MVVRIATYIQKYAKALLTLMANADFGLGHLEMPPRSCIRSMMSRRNGFLWLLYRIPVASVNINSYAIHTFAVILCTDDAAI